MKRKVEIGFIIALILIFTVAVFKAIDWKLYARLFPWIIGFPMIVLALLQLFFSIRDQGKSAVEKTSDGPTIEVPEQLVRWRTIGALAWLIGLLLAILILGFSVSVVLFTFFYLWLESKETLWFAALLTAAAWGFFYGLFYWGINLPLPEGLLFSWLGW